MRKTTKVKHEQKETGREACLLKQNDLCDSKGDGQHIVRRILSFELERASGIKGDFFTVQFVIFFQSFFDQLLSARIGHILDLVGQLCHRNILRRGDLGALLPNLMISGVDQVAFNAGKSILAVSGCLFLQNDRNVRAEKGSVCAAGHGSGNCNSGSGQSGEKCSLVVSSYNDSTSFKAMTLLGSSTIYTIGGAKVKTFWEKTQNKRMEIQSVIVCTVLGKENRTHLTCQKDSGSLDKRIKNHYTTNRKGAVHNGQLLARSVKKIDRLSLDT